MQKDYIHYMRATPSDMVKAIEKAPVAYVPLGALEWHGEQNVLGLDSIKAESICERAAMITGGVVFPHISWGVYDTLNFPCTFHFKRRVMQKMLEDAAVQIKDMGFEVAVFLSGHYPPSQIRHLKRMSRKISKRFRGFHVLGLPEFFLAGDIDYLGDHAAMWETSMMMAIDPSLVHVGELPEDLNFAERAIAHGVFGRHPRTDSSVEKGRLALETVSTRLAALVADTRKYKSLAPYERVLKEFDRHYLRTFSPFTLKRLFMSQGILSAGEAVEYLIWSMFKGGRRDPGYRYPGRRRIPISRP